MKKSELRNIIREIIISELDFKSQDAFSAYNKQHKLRKNTKVNIAGKQTTAGQASKGRGQDNKNKSDFNTKAAKIIKNFPKSSDKSSTTDIADYVADNFKKIVNLNTLPKDWQEDGIDNKNVKRIEAIVKNIANPEDYGDMENFLEVFWDDWSTIDSQWVGGGGGTVSGGQYFSGNSGKSVSTNDRLDKIKGKK